MRSDVKSIESEWITFIDKFTATQIKVQFGEDKKGNQSFIIENVLDSEIDISNKYGFLSLQFEKRGKKDKFLLHTSIEFTVEKLAEYKLRNTQWLNQDYPCRVYISGDEKILSFYDKEETNSIDGIFTDRVVVFRNVISAIVQLKIDDAMQ